MKKSEGKLCQAKNKKQNKKPSMNNRKRQGAQSGERMTCKELSGLMPLREEKTSDQRGPLTTKVTVGFSSKIWSPATLNMCFNYS